MIFVFYGYNDTILRNPYTTLVSYYKNLLCPLAKSLNDVQMQMKCEYGKLYSHIIEQDININKAENMQITTFFQQKIQLP